MPLATLLIFPCLPALKRRFLTVLSPSRAFFISTGTSTAFFDLLMILITWSVAIGAAASFLAGGFFAALVFLKFQTSSEKMMLTGLLTIVLSFAGAIIGWAAVPQQGIPCSAVCHEGPQGGDLKTEYQGHQGCVSCHSSKVMIRCYSSWGCPIRDLSN